MIHIAIYIILLIPQNKTASLLNEAAYEFATTLKIEKPYLIPYPHKDPKANYQYTETANRCQDFIK